MKRFDHEKLDVYQAAIDYRIAGRDLLLRIVSMLIGMIRRDSAPGTGTGTGTKEEAVEHHDDDVTESR